MFFISSAQAQTTAAAGDPGLMSSLIMFGGLFIFMYLFINYSPTAQASEGTHQLAKQSQQGG